MEPVKVAAVQAAPVLLDRDETIGKVVTLAEKAAAEGARLVAFPEAFVPGYPDWVWRTRPWDADATALYARLFDQAVVVGSPATDLLAETAGRLGIWLSVGVDERDDRDSTIYNALLHFAPDGTLAARHRKAHAHRWRTPGVGDGRRIDPAGRRHRIRQARRADLLGELHAPGPGRPVRPGHRRLPGAYLGQLRGLGADPAAHRPGGPHLRDRRHLLHQRRRPARGPARPRQPVRRRRR